LIQSERGWLAPLDGTIEHRSVGQGSVIVDLHRVCDFRGRAAPFLDGREDCAGLGFLGAGFCHGFREERGPRFLLSFRDDRGADLLQLLNLWAECLEVYFGSLFEDPIGDAGLHEIKFRLAQAEGAERLADG